MHTARVHRRLIAGLGMVLGAGVLTLGPLSGTARADRSPPEAAIAGPGSLGRQPFPARGHASRRPGDSSGATGGWWIGTAGIALALAACGAVSVASKRLLPQSGTNALRVVGRTSLSPKHTVYLLQAGDRVLIVGAGPQGAPSLLGELTGSGEPQRPGAGSTQDSATERTAGARRSMPSFDRRVGDDE
jgi:flagellar biogenesis protein FliO